MKESAIRNFNLAAIPKLFFGNGRLTLLPEILKSFGSRVVLVTGVSSFRSSVAGALLEDALNSAGYSCRNVIISGEPSPAQVDEAVSKIHEHPPDVVVAIGGGSVLDAGKAISAMIPLHEPVIDYLEGVGTRIHPGKKVPFIAVPTTAGTGSEATKNAVLSQPGPRGFKKSLRHDNFVPDVSIVDPSLSLSCPPSATAASGMDAFTQLLESWLSTGSGPFTDALACDGLRRVAGALVNAYNDGADISARTEMAYGAWLSGITLANAGLGLVHGFASVIGGLYPVAHGIICSSLIPATNYVTIRRLREEGENAVALRKYALAGRLFLKDEQISDEYATDHFLYMMDQWKSYMQIPGLRVLGIDAADFRQIAEQAENKNNPVSLGLDERMEVLELSF